MKRILLTLSLIFFIAQGDLLLGQNTKKGEKKKEKNLIQQLAPKYRNWLEVTTYIITKGERSTFLNLKNDRDRDLFITLFWNLRDPTPETEENEFKQEHIRRIQYANKYFKYGSTRAGWKTDMGKIYIILGEPDSKERYEMDTIVLPAQIWYYYGKERPGLPSSFLIVFWKKHGLGEYRIYDPASDGPYSLIRKTSETAGLDMLNHQAIFEAIETQHPQLARASLTLIPGETSYNFNPSLISQQLLLDVVEHPLKKINETYATNFLKYKGKVDIDYSINYIESHHKTLVLKNLETGLNFIHFSLRPTSLSIESSGGGSDTLSFSFELIVSLNKGNQTIFEYRKRFPYSGNREETLRNFYNSVLISDCFPVVAGNFHLSVMLRNQVNKEFSYFEKKIFTPKNRSLPQISDLLLCKEIKQNTRRVILPFKFNQIEVRPDPRKTFGNKDDVYVMSHAQPGNYTENLRGIIQVQDFFDPLKYQKTYPIEIIKGKAFQAITKKLDPMNPGYYKVIVQLMGANGKILNTKEETFTISPIEHIAGTTNIFKATSLEYKFLYYHVVGLQHMQLDQLDQAETFLNKGFNLRPNYPRLIKDFCRVLMKKNQYQKVLRIIEPLNLGQNTKFDYYAIKGIALFHLSQYNTAIENLVEANRIYDSDLSVLNTLGFAYLRIKNINEAKKIFSASLKVNKNQKNIQEALKSLEK